MRSCVASIRRLIDYIDIKRLVVYLSSIGMCLAFAYEASSTISIKNDMLIIEFSSFWSQVKTVRVLPVSDIHEISVVHGISTRGCGGPQSVEIVSHNGEKLEFGSALDGGGARLGGVAYDVESLLKHSIRTHQDVGPVRVFPNTIWNGVAFVIFIFGGLFFVWKKV